MCTCAVHVPWRSWRQNKVLSSSVCRLNWYTALYLLRPTHKQDNKLLTINSLLHINEPFSWGYLEQSWEPRRLNELELAFLGLDPRARCCQPSASQGTALSSGFTLVITTELLLSKATQSSARDCCCCIRFADGRPAPFKLPVLLPFVKLLSGLSLPTCTPVLSLRILTHSEWIKQQGHTKLSGLVQFSFSNSKRNFL